MRKRRGFETLRNNDIWNFRNRWTEKYLHLVCAHTGYYQPCVYHREAREMQTNNHNPKNSSVTLCV
jgi:hypothetical protein